MALGMTPVAALYVAVALTFSSTIIIVKLLSDKREVDTLHGRIALGFLIVQDLVVVLVMIGINALGEMREVSVTNAALAVLLEGRCLSAVRRPGDALCPAASAAAAVPLPGTAGTVWYCLGRGPGHPGGIAGIQQRGGCLCRRGVAGVHALPGCARFSRLVSLRDFLLLFFFIDLGARLDLGLLGSQLVEALVFSLFVLIGNPLIVMVIMGALGYRKRTGFLAGLTVAQISEFSLILGALGLSLGHINAETMGLITLVGLITISASTYMIIFSHPLYERLAPWLDMFERERPWREVEPGVMPEDGVAMIILFGMGRYGSGIAHVLRERGYRVLGVDYNPELVRTGDAMGHPVVYGDAEDPDFIASLPYTRARWIVCTAHEGHVSRALIDSLRSLGYAGRIAVTAHGPVDIAKLQQAGADLVMLPYADAAREAADLIQKYVAR